MSEPKVYKPPFRDWQTSFCIVPKLNASFDQEIYVPYSGKVPNITAVINFPENCKFEVDKPAKITSKSDNSLIITTSASENELAGSLTLFLRNRSAILFDNARAGGF